MPKILQKPLFPTGKVKAVAVSCENKSVISALENLNIDCFAVPISNRLDNCVCSHADCRIVQLNSNSFICDEDNISDFAAFINNKTGEIVKIITNRVEVKNNFSNKNNNQNNTIYLYPEIIKSPYPGDVALNVRICDNHIICNRKTMSNYIVDFAQAYNKQIIHTNQGYSACSTVLLNNDTLLTDDQSIYNAVQPIEFFCTMLSKGTVKLNGCNYGFIGGCCGFIDKNLLAFTGKLNSHKDCKIIKEILNKNKIEYIELTNEELTDIGGIIPIIEQE